MKETAVRTNWYNRLGTANLLQLAFLRKSNPKFPMGKKMLTETMKVQIEIQKTTQKLS